MKRRSLRAHLLLSALYLVSRAVLWIAGLRFSFSLDWMWLSDPADLRERLLETLFYFHAFPPGMNAVTGMLLKLSTANAAAIAHALFFSCGLLFVNTLCYLGRAAGLSHAGAFALALAFSVTPPALYFEHLYLYEWPVATLLSVSALLFYLGIRNPARAPWLAFFAVCAVIGWTRSTFHLVWFAALLALGAHLTGHRTRRLVVASALAPAALLLALFAKNLLVVREFAASTFGPASYALVTVARLPQDVRTAWIREGHLSPFAGISVYTPPRGYRQYFATPDHDEWPAQMTRLEHPTVAAANYNHWWLLEVHHARRADVLYYLQHRPFEYLRTAAAGAWEMFGPSTSWHPRDGTPASPHHAHRQVLGAYETWFNSALHSLPFAPVGLYVLLPLILGWTLRHASALRRSSDNDTRARGALLVFCVFQIVYVVAASSLLTALESARYRFQVEWAIWLLAAVCGARLLDRFQRIAWRSKR